jgi:hypothetical protein
LPLLVVKIKAYRAQGKPELTHNQYNGCFYQTFPQNNTQGSDQWPNFHRNNRLLPVTCQGSIR